MNALVVIASVVISLGAVASLCGQNSPLTDSNTPSVTLSGPTPPSRETLAAAKLAEQNRNDQIRDANLRTLTADTALAVRARLAARVPAWTQKFVVLKVEEIPGVPVAVKDDRGLSLVWVTITNYLATLRPEIEETNTAAVVSASTKSGLMKWTFTIPVKKDDVLQLSPEINP